MTQRAGQAHPTHEAEGCTRGSTPVARMMEQAGTENAPHRTQEGTLGEVTFSRVGSRPRLPEPEKFKSSAPRDMTCFVAPP
eukprot:CAMPEP_0171218586 /NCGR_PEP_ID=MMETSP0790-20130122/33278_1 /TAXON_ID=2925 /ORGANISM="Alexandrium catenella, Strain OF101" /LENGTH=80 /DNA_ID=CAMNT_0011684413 /DNA_START=98 /DNA_END=337 /DNA_ORIENTATION=-